MSKFSRVYLLICINWKNGHQTQLSFCSFGIFLFWAAWPWKERFPSSCWRTSRKSLLWIKKWQKTYRSCGKGIHLNLCLLKEEKLEQALVMAKGRRERFAIWAFFGEPREWLKPLREMKEFRRWEASLNPSALLHGPMVGQVTDLTASFSFRLDGPCEIEVEITGHSSRGISQHPKKKLSGWCMWMVFFPTLILPIGHS